MVTLDRSAFRIALMYALFGVAWIVFSDDLMLAVAPDMRILAQLGTWKGLAFVLITACVVYLVAGRRPIGLPDDGVQAEVSRGIWPLVLIFVLLASIIVAVGLVGVAYHVSQHKAEKYKQLNAVADLKIDQLETWLGERLGDAQVIGGATVFQDVYRKSGAVPDETGRRKVAERLEDYRRAYAYQAILLLDAAGTVRSSAGDAAAGVPATTRATIRRAIETNRVLFTDIYRVAGRDDKRVAMDFVAPVRTPGGQELVVVLRIDPRQFLYPLIQAWPTPSRTAETLLFRAEADRVVFLNDLRHRPDTALKLSLPLSDRDALAVKMVNGEAQANGEVEGIDYRKVPVIGVARAVPGTNWYMVAKVDKEELYGSGTREAGWIILVDTLVLILAAAASILVNQRREMRLTLARRREQDERLRTLGLLDAIAEGTTDAIMAKDGDGRYIFVNREAARLHGRTREALLGHDDRAIFPADVARRIRDKDKEVMASGLAEAYEATYPLPGGERTFLMTKAPLRGPDGQVNGVFGIARDITERKQAEDAIRANERRFRSLFDNMLNGLAYCRIIYDQDQPVDFIYLEVNPAFGRLTGLSDVVGKRVTEAIPGIRAANPELFDIFGRVAATGVPEKFETFVAPLDDWYRITVYSPEQGCFVAIFDIVTESKRAESALRESETRFSTVFRASPVGICINDLADACFLDVNDTFLRLFGLTREEVVGLSCEMLNLWVEPGSRARMIAMLGEQGGVRNLELRFRHHSGAIGDALVSAERIELDGRPYLLEMIVDVSDLRLAERQARQREAVLDSVFHTLPDLFFLLDPDGTIRDFRARADTALYVEPASFLGKHVRDVMPGPVADLFDRHIETVLDQGCLVRFEYDLDIPIQGPCRFEARLAKPEGGGQVIAVVRDITREHHDRLALAESEERFVRALENIPDVVVIYDRDLRIRYINGAITRLTGRPVSDFIGRHDDEIWPPEVCEAYLPALKEARATATIQVLETDLNLPSGRLSLQITCIPLLDAAGRVYEVMGVTHDLTRRKLAEQEILQLNAELEQRVRERTLQLQAANKELDTFAYSVSHDLKAPLRGIDGYSQLLVENGGTALDDDCRLFVRNIRAGTEQMKQLIDDLLAYSRMERRALQNSPVAVADVVATVLAERQAEIRDRGVEVRVDLPSVPVRADLDGLLFVLRNLVDNALKFSRDSRPPVIEFGGRVEGEGPEARQVVWIKDNGIGFEMKFHDRIFEIFQRLQRAEDYSGTGIGLAIVQKSMQRMKGRAWAESEPGRGATFYLELPA